MISFASISRGVSDALGSLQLEPIHGPCVKTNDHDRAPEAHVITMRGGGVPRYLCCQSLTAALAACRGSTLGPGEWRR